MHADRTMESEHAARLATSRGRRRMDSSASVRPNTWRRWTRGGGGGRGKGFVRTSFFFAPAVAPRAPDGGWMEVERARTTTILGHHA